MMPRKTPTKIYRWKGGRESTNVEVITPIQRLYPKYKWDKSWAPIRPPHRAKPK